MKTKNILMAATACLALGAASVSAQPMPPPGNDPRGYYSQYDHNGYYDRDGHYQRLQNDRPGYDGSPPPLPPPGAYYEQGRYEQNCHRGNAAAGTIFGAIAGGLIGSGLSHGNGGAVVGGAVLGGILGNAVSQDIDCDDQPYAFSQFSIGLNGDIGRRYDWRHGHAYGYFTPTREYRRGGIVCRDFTETSYRGGQSFTHTGTACRQTDGNWRFD